MFQSLGKLVLYLVGDATSYTRMLNSAQKDFRRATETIRQIGSSLTLYVSVPIISVSTASANMAMEFGRAMSRIEGLANQSQRQVQAWKKDVLDASVAFGKAPTELAKGLFFVTSTGMKGAQALDTLNIAAKAAASGMGDTNKIALAIVAAMNAYAKSGLTAARAADILTESVVRGNIEIDSLAPIIGRILPIASAMGMSFEDVGATIAILTRTGSTAAEAMVGVQGILKTFAKPSVQAEKALKAVGLSFQQLRDMIQRPGGMIEAIRLLDKAMDRQGQTGELADVFGDIRPLKASMNLLAQSPHILDEITAAVTNSSKGVGSLQKAFNAAAREPAFKFDQMMAQIKVTMIQFGDSVLKFLVPVFEKITEGLKMVTDWWATLDPFIKNTIVITVTLVAAIGPVILAFVGFGLAIAGVITSITGIVGAISFLVANLATIGIVVGVAVGALATLAPFIGALAAPIVAFVIQAGGFAKAWKKVQDAIAKFYKFVEPILTATWSLIKALWDLVEYSGVQVWKYIEEIAVEAWKYITESVGNFERTFLAAMGFIFGESMDTWAKIRDNAENAIYFIEYAITHVQQVWAVVVAAIQYHAIASINTLKHYAEYAVTVANSLKDAWVDVFKIIYETGLRMFENLFSKMSGLDWRAIITGQLDLKAVFVNQWVTIAKGFDQLVGKIPKLEDRVIGEQEQGLKKRLESLGKNLMTDFSTWLANKKGARGQEEVERAAELGKKTGEAYTRGLAREVNTIEAVLFRSAAAMQKIREYAALLRGEEIGSRNKGANAIGRNKAAAVTPVFAAGNNNQNTKVIEKGLMDIKQSIDQGNRDRRNEFERDQKNKQDNKVGMNAPNSNPPSGDTDKSVIGLLMDIRNAIVNNGKPDPNGPSLVPLDLNA